MNVSLTPELERLVQEKVTSGMYPVDNEGGKYRFNKTCATLSATSEEGKSWQQREHFC